MADKEYKDLTPEEKYESALKAEKEPWNPLKAAKEIIVEKFTSVKPKVQQPTPEKKMKKGGKVKCMAKGGKASQLSKANGIAIKGKSKGRII